MEEEKHALSKRKISNPWGFASFLCIAFIILVIIFSIFLLPSSVASFIGEMLFGQLLIFPIIIIAIILGIVAFSKRENKFFPIISIMFAVIILSILMLTGLWDQALLKICYIYPSLDEKSTETFAVVGKDEKIIIEGVSIPLNKCEACEVAKQTYVTYIDNKGCNCGGRFRKENSGWTLECGTSEVGTNPPIFWEIDEIKKSIFYGAL